MIRRITLAFVMCLALGNPLWAEDLTIRDFLASAKNDGALDQENEKLAFLDTTSPNTPYLDGLEFRTATDEFRATNQSYRLRVYPNGWGETAAGEELFDTTVALTEAQREMVLHQALSERYLVVVDYLYAKTDLDLHKKLELLQKDRLTVFERRVNSIDFDVNDLIEAENDLLRLQMDIPALETRLFAVKSKIIAFAGTGDRISFEAEALVGMDIIKQVLEHVDSYAASEQDNIYLRTRWLRLEEDRCRYDLEKSQSRRYVSFLEASYDNKDREHAREAYSLELGIELPFVNSNRLDSTRRKLDYLTEKSRYEEAKRSIVQEGQGLKNELGRLITHYERIAGSKNVGARYRQAEGADPLVLLKVRESLVQRDCALNDIRHEIYRSYIQLLDVTGKLSRTPIKNHLSDRQEELGL